MTETGNLLSDGFLAGLTRMYRAWLRGEFTGQSPRGRNRPQPPGRPTIAFVLLENLESGGRAEALILERTERPVQIVTLKGNVTGGSFYLSYEGANNPTNPNSSGIISWDAAADEMQDALEEIEAIGPGDVRVTLGKTAYVDPDGDVAKVVTGRWFVEFLNVPDPNLLQPFEYDDDRLSGDPNDITAETHFLIAATQTETIHAAIPVGYPTPQQAGAIGSAHWIHGIGYVVDAIECRDFNVDTTEYGY